MPHDDTRCCATCAYWARNRSHENWQVRDNGTAMCLARVDEDNLPDAWHYQPTDPRQGKTCPRWENKNGA